MRYMKRLQHGNGSTSWSGNYSCFPISIYPFFGRGGNCNFGSAAGVFCFDAGVGNGDPARGFRPVLVAP